MFQVAMNQCIVAPHGTIISTTELATVCMAVGAVYATVTITFIHFLEKKRAYADGN
jgi:hypothetical protein